MELIGIDKLTNKNFSIKKKNDKNFLKSRNVTQLIKKYGQLYPIIVDSDLNIIKGHSVYSSCKELEIQEVWIKKVNITDDSDKHKLYLELNMNHLEISPVGSFEYMKKVSDEDISIPFSRKDIKEFIGLLNFDWSQYKTIRKKDVDGLF